MPDRRRYIEHLTLDTGDQRRSYRDEVADDVIATLRPLLDRAIASAKENASVDVPGSEPSCTMVAIRTPARGLLATVYAKSSPLVTLGVAPTSLASAHLWREWRGSERDDRTPAPPWCVVQLWPGLLAHPQAAEWLADFERCVAWAWLESPTAPQSAESRERR